MNNIKEQTKEKIKRYSNEEYLNKYIQNEFLTDDKNADIFLKINNNKELFNSKTYANQLDVDNSVYNYIDNKASMLNNDIQLRLRIIGLKTSETEKNKIKQIIHEHYAIELYKVQKEKQKQIKKVSILTIIGSLFLICYALIAFNFASKFFIEVFGFLFSFTLWIALETLYYTLTESKAKSESLTQKLIMDIDFE